jgi:hypothetical protein
MYRLQNFMQLGSQHSMRVYELIKMQEGLRHLCLSVEELREVLCCKHTYGRFSDFRRHVLERARTEIKDTCDTYYTYTVERDGRTPVRVRFLIHRWDETGTPPLVEREEDIPAENQQEANGAHLREHGAGGTAPNGSAVPPPASTEQLLQKAERRYDLYASVLSRLEQGTLDDISRSTVHSALQASREAVSSVPSGAEATTAAEHVVRSATGKLQE